MSGLIDLSGNNLRINYSDTIQNIVCTPTSTVFFNEIDLSGGMTFGQLPDTFIYTSDMIGYTKTGFGSSGIIPSFNANTIYTVRNVPLVSGIYIIYLFANLETTSNNTIVTKISLGITTTTATFTGGTGEIIVISNTTSTPSATAAGRIVGKTLITLNVPQNAIYYFVGQVSASPQPTWDRSFSYCTYTRIA